MALDNLLSVEHLQYRYGDRVAVHNATFQIRRGEVFGFLGPNGAGKTTVISCIAGQLGDWQGTMIFAGRPFAPAETIEDRSKLGLVPQELAIYEPLTARENLQFFGRLGGLRGVRLNEAVANSLSLAGLVERANDRVKEYSGGMKRRLNLAIGQVCAPELLLLDEPTVGVDPQSRNHIFECLLKLRAEGKTLLYTTHYMEEAERLCDRIAIMNDGLVMAIGTPGELADIAGIPGGNLEQVFLKLTGRNLRD